MVNCLICLLIILQKLKNMTMTRVLLLSSFFLFFQNVNGQDDEFSIQMSDSPVESILLEKNGKSVHPGIFFLNYSKLFKNDKEAKREIGKFRINYFTGVPFFVGGALLINRGSEFSNENPEKKYGLIGGGALLTGLSINYLRNGRNHVSNAVRIHHFNLLQDRGYSNEMINNFKSEAIYLNASGKSFVKGGVKYPSKILVNELEDYQFSQEEYSKLKKKNRISKVVYYSGIGLLVGSIFAENRTTQLGLMTLALAPSYGSGFIGRKSRRKLNSAIWAHNNELLLPKD